MTFTTSFSGRIELFFNDSIDDFDAFYENILSFTGDTILGEEIEEVETFVETGDGDLVPDGGSYFLISRPRNGQTKFAEGTFFIN